MADGNEFAAFTGSAGQSDLIFTHAIRQYRIQNGITVGNRVPGDQVFAGFVASEMPQKSVNSKVIRGRPLDFETSWDQPSWLIPSQT